MSNKKIKDNWRQKLDYYFIAWCRKVFRWSPSYREALKAAFVRKDENGEWYSCRNCKSVVQRKNKQLDHISPVVPIGTRWSGDWNGYRDGLFVESKSLQVLCKACHKEKTQKENKKRKQCKTQ